MAEHARTTEHGMSLSAKAARNLATATVTVPQMVQITPRWLHKLLPWVNIDGGVYRVNRVAKAAKGEPANDFGEEKVDVLTVDGGEPELPTTFVDYEANPREYHLSSIQTVVHTHTRVTDLYSNRIDQLREQVRLTVEAVKEREEWELINHPQFGLLKAVVPAQRIEARKGTPTPDDFDELLSLVWKKPAFFLAHPRAIAAFGREATRRGVPPPTVNFFGSPFITWRGIPVIPSNKLEIDRAGKTSILLLRVGESQQGVVGLQKAGVTGEVEAGLSVRYMGTNEQGIAAHLITRYFSTAVLTEDAIARLDNVSVKFYHDYVYPRDNPMTPTTDNVTLTDDDPFGTTSINRLANELFMESAGSSSIPTPTSHAQSTSPAGLPEGGSGQGITPTSPTNAPRYPGLAGGYPSATPETHPPVHPGLQGALPPATGAGTQSGGHDPSSGQSYPFGEPRCNGTGAQNLDTPSATQPSPGSIQTNPYSPKSSDIRLPFSGFEDLSTPDFYFLRGPDVFDARMRPPASPLTHGLSLSSLNIDAIRRDFPVLHQQVNGQPLIWLDNAATTQKPRKVIDATSHFYNRDYSNIHRGAHTLAQRSTELYEGGREKVQRFIGAADSKEIVFVRGTTEAINLVAQSYGRTHVGQGDEILLTTMEHHANIVPWQMLVEQTGAALRVAPINDAGELILEEFAALLGPRTKLVAVTQVSNALGTINPVEQIIAMAHAQGVPVLVDGAQSTPHMPVNVQTMDCDFFTFSGHKIFGPTGIGVLYGKADLLEAMPPWQGGGNMIKDVMFQKTTYQSAPQKFEAGTPAIAEVVGLGAAIDYVSQVGMPAIAAYEHDLLMYATNALSSVPGLRPIGTATSKASVLSFVMDGVSNEQVARHLDQHGIAVRAGHHCAQPTVRRYGLTGTVRPSLAFYNTHDEIDALVQALHQLRRD